jgi:hypothetical protein
MGKIKLGMTLDKSFQSAKESGGLNLKDSVLVRPDQVKINNAKVTEKRTANKMTYLTNSEMEEFLSLIGRKTFSDATRELILEFIKKNK